ncbi:uncharacterized protein LOC127550240 isoform X4 [Antechinus flavipes]|uniref:uncharacterized protein LOC127550240 isoform X4 n=1 Tax=Antechinus flavipes TaxID=38775 RepID=UPI0022363C67|nr:uncharacterized protein LOC127550240 isoform X4 [Antechinus flavipes]XP_051834920.1 uncharacterized protein LOC127550240 isoform X4 [Antechinus flavipes]
MAFSLLLNKAFFGLFIIASSGFSDFINWKKPKTRKAEMFYVGRSLMLINRPGVFSFSAGLLTCCRSKVSKPVAKLSPQRWLRSLPTPSPVCSRALTAAARRLRPI